MHQLTPSTERALSKLMGRVFEARASADGRPFIVAHLITNRCNCKCASCLWRNNDSEDAPTDDLLRFYKQAKEEGFVATAISGGEPFLRKDLGQIVRFVKEELEMSILQFTTGWFLKQRLHEVVPYVDMMIMSLDSAKPERHDRIRGLPGLFDRLIEGATLVREHYPDVMLHFNCCVQKGIADEVDDLIQLAEKLGIHISFDVITEYRHGENGTPFVKTDRGMPLEELQEVCEYLLQRKRTGAPILNSELYFNYFAQGRRGYRCHLPKVVMFVDGRGNVEDCLNLNRPIGNLRETPLGEIMARPRFKQLRADAEACSSCNSPTMVDVSHVWENPELIFQAGGVAIA
ncbi:radical SAM protein [Planctomycetota bacterium]